MDELERKFARATGAKPLSDVERRVLGLGEPTQGGYFYEVADERKFNAALNERWLSAADRPSLRQRRAEAARVREWRARKLAA